MRPESNASLHLGHDLFLPHLGELLGRVHPERRVDRACLGILLLRQHVAGDFRRQGDVVDQDRAGEALGEVDLTLVAEDEFAGQLGDVRARRE